jgi:predicted nucleic acid-binding protein
MWEQYYCEKIMIDPEMIFRLLGYIFNAGIKVSEMPETWPAASCDRNDDPFLYAAVNGGAEYIISSDRRHMLSLQHFRGIPIGRPQAFFEWVKTTYPIETVKGR